MVSTVFLLWHSKDLDEEEDLKVIGIYDSRDFAQAIVEKYRELPGFRDYKDGFFIQEHEINKNLWTSGFIENDD